MPPQPRPTQTTRILLIEDSNTDAMLIQAHLRKADPSFVVRREVRLADGLAQVARGEADVILLDLNLPDSAGLDTFRSLYRSALQVPIVVLSGQDDVDLAVDAVSLALRTICPKVKPAAVPSPARFGTPLNARDGSEPSKNCPQRAKSSADSFRKSRPSWRVSTSVGGANPLTKPAATTLTTFPCSTTASASSWPMSLGTVSDQP